MPLFRVGNVIRDHVLMERAKDCADEWLQGRDVSAEDRAKMQGKWERRFGLVGVG